MSVGAIRMAGAFVEIFGDDRKLQRTLAGAQRRLKAWSVNVTAAGRVMAGLGGAGITSLLGATKVFADWGSQIHDIAARTGLTTEAVSTLGYVASQAGTDLGSLEKGISKMQRVITAGGDVFEKLGIDIEQLRRMDVADQFVTLAGAVGAIEDDTLQAATAMELFGKSGTQLIQVAELGTDELRRLTVEAGELGHVMSAETAASADALGDSYGRLGGIVRQLVANVGGALAPLITDLSVRIGDNVGKVSEWIRENRGVIVTALKVAGGIAAIGGALMALGPILTATSMGVGLLSTTISGVTAAVAFLATPLGAIVAPIGIVVGGVLHFSGALKDARTELGKLGPEMSETWGAIKSLLAAGDVENSLKLVAAAIKLAWHSMLDDMKNAWDAFWLDDSFDVALEDWQGNEIFGIHRKGTQTFDAVSDATKAAQAELDDLQQLAEIAANRDEFLRGVEQKHAVELNRVGLGMLFGGGLNAFSRGGIRESGVIAGDGFAEGMIEGFEETLDFPDLQPEIDRTLRLANSQNSFDAVDANSSAGLRAALNAVQPADQSRRLDTLITQNRESLRELRIMRQDRAVLRIRRA